MKIKQGTVLPTTGIGTGYLLVFIYCLIGWNMGFEELRQNRASYILLIIPAIMQFSYKDFILKEDDFQHYYYRYRILFIFRFKIRHRFRDFSSIVIRVMNKSYNVQQGVGPGISIGSGKHREKYVALVGYGKSSEVIEICKGKQQELDRIISDYILTLDLPVYYGAPKKGYEYFSEDRE